MNIDAIHLPEQLLEQMAATQQNPRFHGEGSVLDHTRLVLRRFHEMKSEFDLTPSEERMLEWAAILHDVGKVSATRFEGGRWRSPGHEKAGIPVARNLLFQQPDLTPTERRQILQLVRWHGFPLAWMLNKCSLNALKKLGIQTDLRLLAIFAMFDLHGRECERQDFVQASAREFLESSVPRVEYEMGRYADLQERFGQWNLRHKNAAWKALQMGQMDLLERLLDASPVPEYNTRGKKVTLTVGPPKSGKTDYIREHFPHQFHVQLIDHGFDSQITDDDYYFSRKLVEFKHLLTVYLNRHRHVVLEGWNVQGPVRRRLTEMLRDQEIEFELLVFEAPLTSIQARNQQSDTPLPEDTLAREYDQWDLLHPWEAHRIQYVQADAVPVPKV